MTTPPRVPRQRSAPGARADQPAQVVEIDADVLLTSAQHPLVSLDQFDQHAVSVLIEVLLGARGGVPAPRGRAVRGEALVHHLVTRSAPADLVRHGAWVGAMVRALAPQARADLLAELGPLGGARRALVERLATAGDATARAYAVGCSAWSGPTGRSVPPAGQSAG